MNRKSYQGRHPDEFLAALRAATEDGSVILWTMGQLTGQVAPPGITDDDPPPARPKDWPYF
jgi:hypothetical protein